MNCFGTSLKGFVGLFWGPKRAKVSLDGLPKWSKRADIAISSDFENMHFTKFFRYISHGNKHLTCETHGKNKAQMLAYRCNATAGTSADQSNSKLKACSRALCPQFNAFFVHGVMLRSAAGMPRAAVRGRLQNTAGESMEQRRQP